MPQLVCQMQILSYDRFMTKLETEAVRRDYDSLCLKEGMHCGAKLLEVILRDRRGKGIGMGVEVGVGTTAYLGNWRGKRGTQRS